MPRDLLGLSGCGGERVGGEKKYLLLVLAVERNKGKKREKEIREEGEKEKGNERKEDPTAYSSDFWHSNGRSSSGQELKSVYSTRATLQGLGSFLLGLFMP